MAVQFDLITPVVVLGILLLLMLSLQQFMSETTAENRQIHLNHAETAIAMQIVDEQLRGLDQIVAITDSTLRYVTAADDSVRMWAAGTALVVRRVPSGGTAVADTFDVGLEQLRFTLRDTGGAAPFFLMVRIGTEKSVTEREFYLRNLE